MVYASSSLDTRRPLETAAGLLVMLRRTAAPPPRSSVTLRAGRIADLHALEALEMRAFAHDRIARRSFVRFLTAPNAALIVADGNGALCGYALVLFRARSRLARLYSIAVDADHAGRRIGSRLLSAAEDVAYRRRCKAMRLEVREGNIPARHLYGKSGYRSIRRLLAYYEDGTDALRLQKRLDGSSLSFDSRARSYCRRPLSSEGTLFPGAA